MEDINKLINSLLRGEEAYLSKINYIKDEKELVERSEIKKKDDAAEYVLAIITKNLDEISDEERLINVLKAGDIVILDRDKFNKLKMVSGAKEVKLDR